LHNYAQALMPEILSATSFFFVFVGYRTIAEHQEIAIAVYLLLAGISHLIISFFFPKQ